MEIIFHNRVMVFGNNVDTDQIYPGRFLDAIDPIEIGRHCFAGVREDIAANFPKGGIVIAGRNFGCGSSREHAPIALLNMGAAVVLADSFARIFYRNAINLGLPLVVCPGLSERVQDGDTITVDIGAGKVTLPDNTTQACDVMSSHTLEILNAGGIKSLMRKKFSIN